MTPESISMIMNDWMLHILAGVLLVLFSYLVGQRRTEKVSMSTKDCADARESCRELLKTEQKVEDVIQDGKLTRIEDRMKSLEDHVGKMCKKVDSLRRLVDDFLRQQGFEDRRGGLDTEREYGPSLAGKETPQGL